VSEVIAAHGGSDRWHASTELSVRVSAGGLAVASKLQRRGLYDLQARVWTDDQRVVFSPYPGPGYRGVYERGAVRIESDDGHIIRTRADPRSLLRSPRHLLWWDRLDLLYFGGSALWTYMAIPFIFADRDFQVQTGKPWMEVGQIWRTLTVTFPAEIHTHSRRQVFYVGDDGLIQRHDYTAEEFGQWAKSAHYWYDHHDFAGLVVPKQRRVLPRRADNHPRRQPVLVWVNISEVTPGALA
jgi:hypothetical protein